MMRGAALVAVLTLVGCSGTTGRLERAEADELAATFAGRTAGAPVDCVDTNNAGGSFRAVGGTLVFDRAGRLYRNDPVDGCPFLHGDPIVVVEAYGSRVCRNDRFRTISRGTTIPSAYCRFGAFTPYERSR